MPKEEYFYTIHDKNRIEKKTKITKLSNTMKNYQNTIYSPLYDKKNICIGQIISIQNHFIINNKNMCTTLTTIKTLSGVLICNLYYESEINKPYVFEKIKSVPNVALDFYHNKKISIEITATNDELNNRILTIKY